MRVGMRKSGLNNLTTIKVKAGQIHRVFDEPKFLIPNASGPFTTFQNNQKYTLVRDQNLGNPKTTDVYFMDAYISRIQHRNS